MSTPLFESLPSSLRSAKIEELRRSPHCLRFPIVLQDVGRAATVLEAACAAIKATRPGTAALFTSVGEKGIDFVAVVIPSGRSGAHRFRVSVAPDTGEVHCLTVDAKSGFPRKLTVESLDAEGIASLGIAYTRLEPSCIDELKDALGSELGDGYTRHCPDKYPTVSHRWTEECQLITRSPLGEKTWKPNFVERKGSLRFWSGIYSAGGHIERPLSDVIASLYEGEEKRLFNTVAGAATFSYSLNYEGASNRSPDSIYVTACGEGREYRVQGARTDEVECSEFRITLSEEGLHYTADPDHSPNLSSGTLRDLKRNVLHAMDRKKPPTAAQVFSRLPGYPGGWGDDRLVQLGPHKVEVEMDRSRFVPGLKINVGRRLLKWHVNFDGATICITGGARGYRKDRAVHHLEHDSERYSLDRLLDFLAEQVGKAVLRSVALPAIAATRLRENQTIVTCDQPTMFRLASHDDPDGIEIRPVAGGYAQKCDGKVFPSIAALVENAYPGSKRVSGVPSLDPRVGRKISIGDFLRSDSLDTVGNGDLLIYWTEGRDAPSAVYVEVLTGPNSDPKGVEVLVIINEKGATQTVKRASLTCIAAEPLESPTVLSSKPLVHLLAYLRHAPDGGEHTLTGAGRFVFAEGISREGLTRIGGKLTPPRIRQSKRWTSADSFLSLVHADHSLWNLLNEVCQKINNSMESPFLKEAAYTALLYLQGIHQILRSRRTSSICRENCIQRIAMTCRKGCSPGRAEKLEEYYHDLKVGVTNELDALLLGEFEAIRADLLLYVGYEMSKKVKGFEEVEKEILYFLKGGRSYRSEELGLRPQGGRHEALFSNKFKMDFPFRHIFTAFLKRLNPSMLVDQLISRLIGNHATHPALKQLCLENVHYLAPIVDKELGLEKEERVAPYYERLEGLPERARSAAALIEYVRNKHFELEMVNVFGESEERLLGPKADSLDWMLRHLLPKRLTEMAILKPVSEWN
jgi:hypothetical protein